MWLIVMITRSKSNWRAQKKKKKKQLFVRAAGRRWEIDEKDKRTRGGDTVWKTVGRFWR